MTFPLIASVLRFSTIFCINDMRNEATGQLRRKYLWDYHSLYFWSRNQGTRQSVLAHCPGFAFDLLNLVQETKVVDLLPSAYYLCSCQLGDLAQGIDVPGGPKARISPESQQTCLNGRLALNETRNSQLLLTWLDPSDGENSCQKQSCAGARRVLRLRSSVDHGPLHVHPLDEWRPEWKDNLGVDCVDAGKTAYESVREDLWKRLASFFEPTGSL